MIENLDDDNLDDIFNGWTQRENRTPTSEALKALNITIEFWTWFGEVLNTEIANNKDQWESLIDNLFNDACDDKDINGDKCVDEIGLSLDGTRDPKKAPYALLQIMVTIIAYAVQAIRAHNANNINEAWTYATDATYWSGILNAMYNEEIHRENPAVAMAKMSHLESSELIEQALTYWRENIDLSVPAARAANELIKIVPLSHKTLAEHVSKARKEAKK